jgi:predicted transposase YbfD/YdcC
MDNASDCKDAHASLKNEIIERSGIAMVFKQIMRTQVHITTLRDYISEDEDSNQFEHEENDKWHGRIEQRIAVVRHDIDWFQKKHKWPVLKAIGKVTAKVLRKGKETTEIRYYISSLRFDAGLLNNIVRKHLGIENRLHWRLGVVFHEDKACIRNDNAAENMDIIRQWVLAILIGAKDKKDRSIKSLMRRNAMSITHLVKCVKKISHA